MHEVQQDYRVSIRNWPYFHQSGEIGVALPKRLDEKDEEVALIARLVVDRPLFGSCYAGLMPEFFEEMPPRSGVLIACQIPSAAIVPNMSSPGDIDMLVIPFFENELILSKVLAMEVKAVRASFHRQHRSPNRYGFTQARGLKEVGFPFVAVAHLIRADASPIKAWRTMHIAKVIDDDGHIDSLSEVAIDCLPSDLTERALGRLIKNSDDDAYGLVSLFMSRDPATVFFPQTRKCSAMTFSKATLEGIANYYEQNYKTFFGIPRY